MHQTSLFVHNDFFNCGIVNQSVRKLMVGDAFMSQSVTRRNYIIGVKIPLSAPIKVKLVRPRIRNGSFGCAEAECDMIQL